MPKKNDRTLTDDGTMIFKPLVIEGMTYMKIEDIIAWLKANHTHPDDMLSVHWLIKTFVALNNRTK